MQMYLQKGKLIPSFKVAPYMGALIETYEITKPRRPRSESDGAFLCLIYPPYL